MGVCVGGFGWLFVCQRRERKRQREIARERKRVGGGIPIEHEQEKGEVANKKAYTRAHREWLQGPFPFDPTLLASLLSLALTAEPVGVDVQERSAK